MGAHKTYLFYKKLTWTLTGIILLACTTAVSAQKKTERVVEISTAQARNIEPQSSVIVAPQVAELNVSTQKASGRYSYSHDGTVDLSNARAKALSDFQKENKADVIIGALIDTRMNADSVIVDIQGYPATYARFRAATADDKWMLSFYNIESRRKNTESVGK